MSCPAELQCAPPPHHATVLTLSLLLFQGSESEHLAVRGGKDLHLTRLEAAASNPDLEPPKWSLLGGGPPRSLLPSVGCVAGLVILIQGVHATWPCRPPCCPGSGIRTQHMRDRRGVVSREARAPCGVLACGLRAPPRRSPSTKRCDSAMSGYYPSAAAFCHGV